MSWVRYDDTQPTHPKVRALGVYEPLCMHLNHRVKSWCSAQKTDGWFTLADAEDEARRLFLDRYLVDGNAVPLELLIDKLCTTPPGYDHGIWERHEGDRFRIHDYLEYQPSRAEIDARRSADAARKRSGRRGHVRTQSKRTRNGRPHGVQADAQRTSARSQHGASAPPGPARPGPSDIEPGAVCGDPAPQRGAHTIPPDHPLQKATREIYLTRGCRNPEVCHQAMTEKLRAEGRYLVDWHAEERRLAWYHDPDRAPCRVADRRLETKRTEGNGEVFARFLARGGESS